MENTGEATFTINTKLHILLLCVINHYISVSMDFCKASWHNCSYKDTEVSFNLHLSGWSGKTWVQNCRIGMQQRNGPVTLHSASADSCNTTQPKSNITPVTLKFRNSYFFKK